MKFIYEIKFSRFYLIRVSSFDSRFRCWIFLFLIYFQSFEQNFYCQSFFSNRDRIRYLETRVENLFSIFRSGFFRIVQIRCQIVRNSRVFFFWTVGYCLNFYLIVVFGVFGDCRFRCQICFGFFRNRFSKRRVFFVVRFYSSRCCCWRFGDVCKEEYWLDIAILLTGTFISRERVF